MSYINAPQCLGPRLELLARPNIRIAGQLTGVEGYVESAACGLWAGIMLSREILGRPLPPPPPSTALGALLTHLRTPGKLFQPSNAHFGLMPDLPAGSGKKNRKPRMAERARQDFAVWATEWGR